MAIRDPEKILEELISQGYSELSREDIKLQRVKAKDYFMSNDRFKSGYIIEMSGRVLKAPRPVFKGVLAHELSHITLELEMNPLARLFHDCRFRISDKYETHFERRVDTDVIERGFGDELFAFLEWHNERYKSYKKKDGLTAKEVKKLMKQIRT